MNEALDKLTKLYCFTTDDLRSIYNFNDNSLKRFVNRRLKSGGLISLKKGLYTTKDFIASLEATEKEGYLEYISSVLKNPSYLSSEYVLSKNQVLTEGVFGITCMTLKRPCVIKNNFSDFIYRYIKEPLFDGYEVKYFRNSPYYVASLNKALFDYFYNKLGNININDDASLIESERLNLKPFSKKDQKDIFKWAEIASSKKLEQVFSNVFKHASNN